MSEQEVYICGVGEIFQPLTGFLALSFQGLSFLWKHTGPPFPLCGWSSIEAEAGMQARAQPSTESLD